MRTTFFSVLLVQFCFFSSLAAAQETNLESAVVRTLRWADKLGSYDLEVSINKNRKTTIPNSTDGDFSEVIERIREIKNKNGDFSVSKTFGMISIITHNGGDTVNEATVSSYYVGDDSQSHGKTMHANGEVSDSASVNCGGEGRPCLEASRGLSFARLPFVTTFDIPQAESDKDTDVFLNKLLEPRKWDVQTVTSKKGQKSLVFRASRKVSDRSTFGYRITVSDSGYDSGLITEICRYRMKKDQEDVQYTSEEQVVSNSSISKKLTWKEVETTNGKRVLLTNLVHEEINGVVSKSTMNWNLDWKSFSDPKPISFSEEYCQKKCVEFSRQIDKVLGR